MFPKISIRGPWTGIGWERSWGAWIDLGHGFEARVTQHFLFQRFGAAQSQSWSCRPGREWSLGPLQRDRSEKIFRVSKGRRIVATVSYKATLSALLFSKWYVRTGESYRRSARGIMPENAPSHPEINPWLIAIAVMSSTFMEVLDTTVVNVSLPHIAGNLSASTDEATWTLTSYLVANAIILPMTGWLASTFGRKRLLLSSVTGFTIASFLCGLAPSLPFFIVFRIIQGACGGGLQPLSQAILLESFPPEKRGQAMAFWALGIVVAPMLGQWQEVG